MRKAISLMLALVMCFALCACGGESAADASPAAPSDAPSASPEAPVEETPAAEPEVSAEPEPVIYKLGDVIETELYRITPKFTGYAYELANWPDEYIMMPEGNFSGVSAYSAGAGNTAIYGEIQVEYIGNEKSDVKLNIGISADYDNGYIFTCNDTAHAISVDGDWTYDSPMVFPPLSSYNSRIMRYCIEVPEQVEQNKDKPLLVTFSIGGEAFVYDFRSATDIRGSDYDPRGEFYQPIDDETKNQIIDYLKANGLAEIGWYNTTIGTYTFTFGDTTVNAVLPVSSNSRYDFNGTYEVFSGAILLSWDYGEQMHLDYTFDGTTLEVTEFEHGR